MLIQHPEHVGYRQHRRQPDREAQKSVGVKDPHGRLGPGQHVDRSAQRPYHALPLISSQTAHASWRQKSEPGGHCIFRHSEETNERAIALKENIMATIKNNKIYDNINILIAANKIFANKSIEKNQFTEIKDFSHIRMELKYYY